MSAVRSLSGEKRTSRGQPNLVENDPFETSGPLPLHELTAYDALIWGQALSFAAHSSVIWYSGSRESRGDDSRVHW
jgi:hypothetical protein